MWIQREISKILLQNQDLIQVIVGPRQVGKSSLLQHISADYIAVSLDSLQMRTLANQNPEIFLNSFENKKLLIDEAQLAPELFYALKQKTDELKRKGIRKGTVFRLTGSNQILLDRAVKEGLTGRASFFQLNTCSISELWSSVQMPTLSYLYRGGWPELYQDLAKDPRKYLDDYILSYVEKDVILSAGIQKSKQFQKFLALLAGRTGQLFNANELSKEAGVSHTTIEDWASLLEKMKFIYLLPPYFTNSSKRLIKTPKVFFLDTGLACRLQGWAQQEPLLTSPQFGSLFETLVLGELQRFIINRDLSWKLYFARDKEGHEIDFAIDCGNQEWIFVEAKTQAQSFPSLEKFRELEKSIPRQKIRGTLVCHFTGPQPMRDQVPIQFLAKVLEGYL